MKSLFLISLFVLASVSSFAVKYNSADVPNYSTDPQAYLDYWISVDASPSIMRVKLASITQFELRLGIKKATTPETVIALVNNNAAKYNITDTNAILYAKIYNLTNKCFYASALALAQNSTYLPIKRYVGYILYYQKKYQEALATFSSNNNTVWQLKCAVKLKDTNTLLAVANEVLLVNTTKDPKLIITVISEFEKLPVSNDPVIIAGILDKLIDLSAKYPPAVPVAGTEANWAKAAAMVDFRIAKLQKLVNAKIDLSNKLNQ